MAQHYRSFFASFCSQKEAFPSLPLAPGFAAPQHSDTAALIAAAPQLRPYLR
jgi:hypothetical protein